MKGVLYLRFLLDAADSFARDSSRVRFAWINRVDTAKFLRLIFRPSRSISSYIKDKSDDQVFAWVKDQSSRYEFIRVIRHTALSELAAHQDSLNIAFLEANSQAFSEQLGLEKKGVVSEGETREVEEKNSQRINNLSNNYFSNLRRVLGAQPSVGKEVSKEIAQAKEEKEKEDEELPQGGFADHFRELARRGRAGLAEMETSRPSWMRPPATPEQIRETLLPRVRIGPTTAEVAGSEVQRISRIGFLQDASSFGQRFFKVQVYDRARNGLSSVFSRFTGTGEGAAGVVRGNTARVIAGGGRLAGLAARSGGALVVRGGAALAAASPPVALAVGGVVVVIIVILIIVLFVVIAFGMVSKTQPLLVFNDKGEFISTIGSGGEEGGGGGRGGSCPSQAVIEENKNVSTCRYLSPNISLTDKNISDSAIAIYIDKYTKTFVDGGVGDAAEFRRRVNYVVSQSKRAGLNPAIFLGYWKSESLFSTSKNTTADLGCAPGQGRKAFEVEVDCAVGLTPEGGSLASRCASPVITNKTGCIKPITTFDQFAESYGSKAVDPNNCSHTYNILLEVANELNACRSGLGGPVSAPPASADQQQLHSDILNKFGVDMSTDFDYNYLKWAWEKLWNVSNTGFLQLVRGPENSIIKILRSDGPYNEQVTCTTVKMSGTSSATGLPYPESLFKVVFIHELSHIIENCNSANSGFSKLAESVPSKENYLTSYSQNSLACAVTRTDNLKEDYAESVTYYLNLEYPEQDIGICPSFRPKDSLNPYSRENTVIHKQIMTAVMGGSVGSSLPSSELAQFSCPVVGGGRNLLASFQADPVNGHCGSDYKKRLLEENGEDVSDCTGDWRRAKSIDIETGGPNGKNIELPTLDGQNVNWVYVNRIDLARSDCFAEEIVDENGVGGGCGVGHIFKTELGGGNNWVLHLLHLQETSLRVGQVYRSGTLIGKGQAIHTHISVGQNIQNPLSQIDNGSPGWLSVDTQLHLCGS